MKYRKTFLLSNFGNDPDDPYHVINTESGLGVSGVFVLKPSRERSALKALKVFYSELPKKDERRAPLKKYLDQLEKLWESIPNG